jgi:transcriptional regulator with XRE-family HTH domain
MGKLNENLRIIREKAGYSQEELAEKVNKSQSAYARIEKAITKIDYQLLIDFAKVFNMSVIDLITYPEKWVPIGSEQSEDELTKVVLQIELKKEKKDQVLKLVFGDHNIEILNK